VREKKGVIERQTQELVHAHAERDRANAQNADLIASNAGLLASNEAMKDQVATVRTENIDVRRVHEVLCEQLSN
jgi:hypothetical protein